MSVSLDGQKIIMEANGAGYNQYRFPLPSAPSAADVMVFVFRYFYDEFDDTELGQDAGWDSSDCFGLSFDGVIPDDALQDNFFGWVDTDAGQNFFFLASHVNFNGHAVVVGAGSRDILDADGTNRGSILNNAAIFMPGFGTPPNPTIGALYTGIWVFKRDTGSTDKILLTTGGNFESLANLADARLDANTVFGETDTLLTVGGGGNWRNGGGINFPTWVVSKFTSALSGRKFVLDSYKAEYYSYCT